MKTIKIGTATLIHGDCEEFMKDLPDKCFDLACIDPPYGIGMDGGNVGYKGFNNFTKKDWDKKPPDDLFFKESDRVTKNQIIWGGNYFNLRPTRCFLIWDKGEGFKDRTYAECEQAWTSFDANARIFKRDPLANGDYKGKIHPTQKPTKLYEWIYSNYAKPGQTILDTHGGSMSSVIAALNMGFEITCIEKDEDYFNAAVERVIKSQQQQKLF